MIEGLASVGETLLFSAMVVAVAVYTSIRALLYKRDPRAAIAWVGFIWFVPLLGSVFYWLFGVNRIARRARGLRAPSAPEGAARLSLSAALAGSSWAPAHLWPLRRLVDRISPFGLESGNRCELLADGEAAYPAMLEAIEGARRSVTCASYIFDRDRVGIRFARAFERARMRGVAVRVLIDGVGRHYSYPTIETELREREVPVAFFLPTLIPSRWPYVNLRNHRKLLGVDGEVGFTGGMNIRAGHEVAATERAAAIHDLQARLQGPVVAHLQATFADDWAFCTGEELTGDDYFPALPPRGEVIARGIPDGPDGPQRALSLTLQCAIASARHRIRIVTPYFVPDPVLLAALQVAALRGVEVDIVLPEMGNLALVRWAMAAQLWQVLQSGCRVYLTPPPFDHTKLVVVDEIWTLLGSANWDARSLRLNFELDVECYDAELAAVAGGLIDARMARARRISLEDVDGRPFAVRLRDGVARLALPYL